MDRPVWLRRPFPRCRSLRPPRKDSWGWALIAWTVLIPRGYSASDPTFRELADAPSPQRLAERLMQLPPSSPLGPLHGELDGLLRAIPGGARLLQDEGLRRWAASFAREHPEALDPPHRDQLVEQLRERLESDEELRALIGRLTEPPPGQVDSGPAQPGPGAPGARTPDAPSAWPQPGRPSGPAAGRGNGATNARDLERRRRAATPARSTPPQPAAANRAGAPPTSFPQLQSRLQQLVMDAANQVLEDPERRTLAAERILRPAIGALQRILSDGAIQAPASTSTLPAIRRPGRLTLRRWLPAAGAGRAPQASDRFGPIGWTAALVAIIALGGLLIARAPALGRTVHRWTERRRTDRLLGPLVTGADLVRTLDGYLHRRFGRAASWWNCRTVRRSLEQLQPDMALEIASLVATYERARYGPHPPAAGCPDLAEAAETLRRLPLGSEGRFAPRPLASSP